MTILEHHNDETTPLQQCCGQHSNVLSRLYTTSCWPEAGDIRWLLQTVSNVRQLSRGEKCNHKAECLLRRISVIHNLSRWQSSYSETQPLLLPFRMSASCPGGKAEMEKKTKWRTDFPNSTVCSWSATRPIILCLIQSHWLRQTSPKSILPILVFLISIRLK